MTAGDTTTEGPLPINVPPHEPEYHCQLAPVPSDPPTSVSVVDWLGQVGLTDAEILVAAVEFVFTVMVILTQLVELHAPSART